MALTLTFPNSLLAQIATLQRIPPAQAKKPCCKLDIHQIPAGVELWNSRREDRQTAQLRALGSEDLTIIPVLLNNDSPEPKGAVGPGPQCGVYFLRQNGESRYVGLGWPHNEVNGKMVRDDLCEGVVAVAAAHDPGPRPRLIVLLSEETGIGPMGNVAFPYPYILRWNTKASNYEVDAEATIWLQDRDCNGTPQDCGGTVLSARKLLAEYDAKGRSGNGSVKK